MSIKRKLINQLNELYPTQCLPDSKYTWIQQFGNRDNNKVIAVTIYQAEFEEGFTVEDHLNRKLESLTLDELIGVVNQC